MHVTVLKRFAALVCAGVLTAALALPAYAAGTYSDLPSTHWAYKSMNTAAQLGILNGFTANTMAPSAGLTWGQYPVMLSRAFHAADYRAAVQDGLAWDTAGYQTAMDARFLLKNNFLPVTEDTLAEDVKEIFTEIYNDPERFPVCDVGGYSWRGNSARGEHNCGSAIDINPNENYQIDDGQVLVGCLWSPGQNPRSIGPDSSVVRIFREHGWSWGGTNWASSSDVSTGYHDYMHFSCMGG